MKFTINRKSLIEKTRLLTLANKTRQSLPVLSNVLIEAGDELRFTATNLEQFVSATIEATIKSKGSTAVSLSKLHAALSSINADEIEISANEKNVLSIRSDAASFELRGLPAVEFPDVFKWISKAREIPVDPAALLAALTTVSWAQSDDIGRPILNGVCLEPFNGGFKVIATSGKVVAVSSFKCEGVKKGESFILNRGAVPLVEQVLASAEEAVILLSENYFAVQCGRIRVAGKLVEGTFPNTSDVIPKDSKLKFEIPVEEVVSGIDAADLVTSETHSGLTFTFSKTGLGISAKSPEHGSSDVNIPLKSKGNGESCMLASKYIRPALTHAGKSAVMNYTDKFTPFLITADNYTAIVMQMLLP